MRYEWPLVAEHSFFGGRFARRGEGNDTDDTKCCFVLWSVAGFQIFDTRYPPVNRRIFFDCPLLTGLMECKGQAGHNLYPYFGQRLGIQLQVDSSGISSELAT